MMHIKSLPSFKKDKLKKTFNWSIQAISLLFLQLVSLATTLDGAKLLFGNAKMPLVEHFYLAYVLGFGIQLLLISILVFNAFEKVPLRRLLALVLLTIFSIYTNFFSIYNFMNGGLLQENTSIDQAKIKYGELVDYFYTNPKAKLDGLEQQRASLNCSLYREDPEDTPQPKNCSNLGFPGGKKERYYQFRDELDIVEKQLRNLSIEIEYITKTAPKYFDKKIVDSLYKKDARAIYELTQQALKGIPSEIKEKAEEKGYDAQNYDEITDFFPEKGTSYFLIPAQKVFTKKQNREPEAVVAFIIATAIDTVSLLLGAKLHGFYTSLKNSLGSINPIADFFKGFAILITHFINGISEIFYHPRNNVTSQSLKNKLFLEEKNGNGVEFLDNFYDVINKGESRIVNEYSNNFQLYQILISHMCENNYFVNNEVKSRDLNIFKNQNSNPDLILNKESKGVFKRWYIIQRNLQVERERNHAIEKTYTRNLINLPPERPFTK
ncbi:MAG: hypothetical protein KI793_25150 [Rivularia sp. (in: Bacteria)]|nr:hypothetical protein [Rivularia sp. MS3]